MASAQMLISIKKGSNPTAWPGYLTDTILPTLQFKFLSIFFITYFEHAFMIPMPMSGQMRIHSLGRFLLLMNSLQIVMCIQRVLPVMTY